jgi:hypothetical protein
MINSTITISGERFELVDRSAARSLVRRLDLMTNDKPRLPIATIMFEAQKATDLSLLHAGLAVDSYKKSNGAYSSKPIREGDSKEPADVSFETMLVDVSAGVATAYIVQYITSKADNEIWFVEVETRVSALKSYRVAIWDMGMGARILEARVRREDIRTFVYGPYDELIAKNKCGREPLNMTDIYKAGV